LVGIVTVTAEYIVQHPRLGILPVKTMEAAGKEELYHKLEEGVRMTAGMTHMAMHEQGLGSFETLSDMLFGDVKVTIKWDGGHTEDMLIDCSLEAVLATAELSYLGLTGELPPAKE
jgi:hypothetical protein